MFHSDPESSCQHTCVTYTIAVYTVKTPDDGQMNCPKHVEFHSKNKFKKLVHLFGFVLRNSSYNFPHNHTLYKYTLHCIKYRAY